MKKGNATNQRTRVTLYYVMLRQLFNHMEKDTQGSLPHIIHRLHLDM